MSAGHQLPDVCRPRHRGNPESEGANAKIHADKTPMQRAIYLWLEAHPNSSCEEISRKMDVRYTTVSARLSELRKEKWVSKVGIAKTSGGSNCALYVVNTPEEREQMKIQGQLFQ